MKLLAIDVAIVPPPDIIHKIIEVNRRAVKETGFIVSLEIEKKLPHLSLFQAAIKKSDIPKITNSLQTIANARLSLPVTIIDHKNEWLLADNTPELIALHSAVADLCIPYMSADIYNASYAEPANVKIDGGCYPWLLDFKSKCAYENFKPHITVGSTTLPIDIALPLEFQVNRLSLFHMTNYNTCNANNILWENL